MKAIVCTKYGSPDVLQRQEVDRGCRSGFLLPQNILPKIGRYGLQNRDQIAQKTLRVAVLLIKREPGHGLLTLRHSRTDQRGLAKTGQCRDQGQLSVQAILDAFDQTWTRNQFRLSFGDEKFWWRAVDSLWVWGLEPSNLQAPGWVRNSGSFPVIIAC